MWDVSTLKDSYVFTLGDSLCSMIDVTVSHAILSWWRIGIYVHPVLHFRSLYSMWLLVELIFTDLCICLFKWTQCQISYWQHYSYVAEHWKMRMFHEKYVKYLFVLKMFCAALATFTCVFGESALRFKIWGSVIFYYFVVQIWGFYREEDLDCGLVGYDRGSMFLRNIFNHLSDYMVL